MQEKRYILEGRRVFYLFTLFERDHAQFKTYSHHGSRLGEPSLRCSGVFTEEAPAP